MAPGDPSTPPPLTRGDLYKAVWTTPVDRLAKSYGISGVGLSKLCRRHLIPIPPRGHWAKPVKRRPRPPALPPTKSPVPDRILLAYRPQGSSSAATADEEREGSPREGDAGTEGQASTPSGTSKVGLPPTPTVEIPADLSKPHPLVARTLKALRAEARRAPVGVEPLLDPPFQGEPLLNVDVTARSVDRALRLLDALIKALEARGHTYREAIDPRHAHRHPGVHFLDGEDWFTISIQEEVEEVPHVPTKSEERRARAAGRHWSPPEVDTKATGRLRLLLYSEDRNRIRAWGDGKHRRIEDHLGACIAAMEAAACRARELRAEWARREAEAADAERRRREDEERRKAERARMDALWSEVEAWGNARALRAYVAEVRAQAGDDLVKDPELQRWLEWASGIAERMDPLPRRRPRSQPPTATDSTGASHEKE